ncbi:stage V sporulation protein AD [Anaerobranca californiensis DSM 14826]|jgi:stage V sporulation protein AD|uniref:Stage V sporulation protein AD n=1 Tax=Anaerobranca californiensis DSM 14826 TaxID=1120989 RepID=A0A1M6L2M0_9FIRM|nr:stage V sporulation protein AD [Anaerobranca californiensis]SHJ65478.1 stage V sporulation protein AD [Anaerobranca californiensis DSM 14826]
MTKKIGKSTYSFPSKPVIISSATVAGPKEGQGPYGKEFDKVFSDTILGQKSFEKAEGKMMEEGTKLALKKINLTERDIDVFIAGDLLNQTITSNFTASTLGIPFLGLYGACSTFVESLMVASFLVDGGFVQKALIATSSHNLAAERQYRFPTEYGGQRPPYAQHTVTGSGSAIVADKGQGPKVLFGSIGRVMDLGIKDPWNMGAAMAPAAADTIANIFFDTNTKPNDYDLLLTGDLGKFGSSILVDLLKERGLDISKIYFDCGGEIYDKNQDTHSGGSGCACCAIMSLGYYLKQPQYKKIIIVATGALHSPTTYQQGENIPAIAHGVIIEK